MENLSPLQPYLEQQPLTNLQQLVTDKLTQTTERILTNIKDTTQGLFEEMANNRGLKPHEFAEIFVKPKIAPLPEADERTTKFFKCMMTAVDEEIGKRPPLLQSFMMLTMVSNDTDIRKKIVEGIAFPPVQQLIKDFDIMKTSIVDDIIG
jgi:hypothetical protein